MGWLLLRAAVVAVAGAVTFAVAKLRARGNEGSTGRRGIVVASVVAIVLGVGVGAVVVVVSVIDTFERRGLPPPEYPSLIATPDESLQGTVAYLSEAKSPTAGRQACARVAAASGAESKDVLCWPISEPALATMAWQPDGRLLVTSFDAPVGKDTLIPEWAKLVDVANGTT